MDKIFRWLAFGSRTIIFFYVITVAVPCNAQSRFEGEINYKAFAKTSPQSDSTFGDTFKITFGGNSLKIERFDRKGVLFSKKIVFIDSLTDIIVNDSNSTYYKEWDGRNAREISGLPMGMTNEKVVNDAHKKVAGYPTYQYQLRDSHPNSSGGHIELFASESVLYPVPRKIAQNIGLQGLLFFEGKVMLDIRIVAGRAPYGQTGYIATSVIRRRVDPSEFKVPLNYTYLKQPQN